MQARELLLEAFRVAVAAADPRCTLASHLVPLQREIGGARTVVVGAGKAAGSMAAALAAQWPDDAPLGGLVVTRYGHGLKVPRIEVLEAGHPLPDAAGADAAQRILQLATACRPEDWLIALMSGGGSSLLSLPVPDVPLADLQAVTRSLLASGAPIGDINIVRKHLSRIQGGWLAASTCARVVALAISDVAGDDLSAIASGPCAPDPSTYAQAHAVLRRWHVDAPQSVGRWLERGVRGEIAETPKPGDPLFERVSSVLVASAHASLEAAAAHFAQAGFRALVLGDTITGEARDVAQVHAAIAREACRYGERSFGAGVRPPLVLLSGGECSVRVRGGGRGGRNAEFALALALALAPLDNVWALAADTDGIDGSQDNAGAIMTPDTLQRAAALGIDPRACLDDNDAFGFFERLGDLVMTGPTLTNVNDFRAILIA